MSKENCTECSITEELDERIEELESDIDDKDAKITDLETTDFVLKNEELEQDNEDLRDNVAQLERVIAIRDGTIAEFIRCRDELNVTHEKALKKAYSEVAFYCRAKLDLEEKVKAIKAIKKWVEEHKCKRTIDLAELIKILKEGDITCREKKPSTIVPREN